MGRWWRPTSVGGVIRTKFRAATPMGVIVIGDFPDPTPAPLRKPLVSYELQVVGSIRIFGANFLLAAKMQAIGLGKAAPQKRGVINATLLQCSGNGGMYDPLSG